MTLRYNKKRDELDLLLQDREVLELLLKAKSREDICAELNLPLGTLNTCCTRIYQKTGCRNQAGLIVKYGYLNAAGDG